jgi:serine/threonine protein kinase
LPTPNDATCSNIDAGGDGGMSADDVIIEEKRPNLNREGYTVHRYLRGKMLGKGGFAKVYLCTALDTNKAYAIKIVPKANLVKARARQKVRKSMSGHCTVRCDITALSYLSRTRETISINVLSYSLHLKGAFHTK